MEAMRQSWTDDRLDDLRMEMRAGFARTEQLIEQHAKQVEHRFEVLEKSIDQRFEQVDRRFDEVERHFDQRLEQVDQRLEQVDKRLEQIDLRFMHVDHCFERLGNRIDTFTYWLLGMATTIILALTALIATPL